MAERIVVSLHLRVASAPGAGYLRRALAARKRAEVLGAALAAWGPDTFAVDFAPDEVEEAIDLALASFDDLTSAEPRFGAGVAFGDLPRIGATGGAAMLAWGDPLAAAWRLACAAEPGEVLLDDRCPPHLLEALRTHGERHVEAGSLTALVLDVRHPFRRDTMIDSLDGDAEGMVRVTVPPLPSLKGLARDLFERVPAPMSVQAAPRERRPSEPPPTLRNDPPPPDDLDFLASAILHPGPAPRVPAPPAGEMPSSPASPVTTSPVPQPAAPAFPVKVAPPAALSATAPFLKVGAPLVVRPPPPTGATPPAVKLPSPPPSAEPSDEREVFLPPQPAPTAEMPPPKLPSARSAPTVPPPGSGMREMPSSVPPVGGGRISWPGSSDEYSELTAAARQALLKGNVAELERLSDELKSRGEADLADRMAGFVAWNRGAKAEGLRKLRAAADAETRPAHRVRALLAYGVALAASGRTDAALLAALGALARAREVSDRQGEHVCARFLAKLSAAAGYTTAARTWAAVSEEVASPRSE